MKPVLLILAIAISGGAAFFSFNFSQSFKALQTERTEAAQQAQAIKNKLDSEDKEIQEKLAELAAVQQAQEKLGDDVSTLQAANGVIEGEIAKLDQDALAQAKEVEALEGAIAEVQKALEGLGEDVTVENLPDKIKDIEQSKEEKQEKIVELNTLIEGAKSAATASQNEVKKVAERRAERGTRLKLNSTSSVVTAVNNDWGFVVIGAGSNSGFTPQTELIVVRDGRTIGKIIPRSVEPTQVVGDLDRNSMIPGVRVQPGDRVIISKPFTN
ncbi:MAG: hypothetical protein EAZ42_13095 [Verrucomicrobia bacterium]|nr:MAG: hypothetical protein EAZ42_13095 [Verrucomicrobiota bacterium]